MTGKQIKEEIGNNNCQNDIKFLKIKTTITNNPHEIAIMFNDNLLTVADSVIGNIKKENHDPRDNVSPSNYSINNFNSKFPRINWNYATTYEINKITKYLKTKSSHGYDKTPTKMIKLSTPFIISPLTYICNKSLSSGVFPERLKYATIKLVCKKGDKLLTKNYGPISLLTSLSKNIEKLIYVRLYKHI